MPELVHGEGEAGADLLAGLKLALLLAIVVLGIESLGAVMSRSLSVTMDAIHNVPDVAAFALSWAALRVTALGASREYTFGAHRLEVVAGMVNASLILGTGVVFGYESLLSIYAQQTFAGPVDAAWILAIALPTLGLRSVSLLRVGRVKGKVRDLNLRSVVIHLASDLFITLALLSDGILLLVRPAWFLVDAATALVISAVLIYESVPLFRVGWEVITERTPGHLSIESIQKEALAVPGVSGIHDVHVWSVCPTLICMTAHIQVADRPVSETMAVVSELRRVMERDFGILHAVFEVESG